MNIKRKLSMRWKLVLMFLSTTIVANIIVGVIALSIIETHFYNLSISHINNTFEAMYQDNTLDKYDSKSLKGFENANLKVWNVENNQVTYQSSETPLPLNASVFSLKNKEDIYSYRWLVGDDHYVASSCFISPTNTMVLGLNINNQVEFFDTVNTLIIWFTFALCVLAAIYSIVIVNNGLLPLKQFEGYLSQIRPGNLAIRIPTKQLPFELEALGEVQNSMLDRLDEGFKRLSDFSSDIAHELRTPLTNMTTQTQVIMSSDRELAEYHDTLGSNLEELERINKTINDTLYLAKADNSLLHQNDQELDLYKEIAQLVDYHNVVAEEKGLTINLKGQGTYFFDKLMLQRAINNLLSNAIRHASPETTISIIIKQTEELLTIEVSNTGDIIAEESLPYIFERFYRGDKSRKYEYGFGTGLGLAITKSIVETYSGTIKAESVNGNTKFIISVPYLGR